MKDSFLYNKSLAFGVRCVNFYQFLKKKDVYVLSKQLLRSGTSIGANVRESRFAHSPADFILISDKEYQSMYDDADERIPLLVSSIKTNKSNQNV